MNEEKAILVLKQMMKNNAKRYGINEYIKNTICIVKKDGLWKIYNIDNINALSTESELNFVLNGLNVVYGDNGSGKSSYTSILKYACNTRGHKPIINNNLYDSTCNGKD